MKIDPEFWPRLGCWLLFMVVLALLVLVALKFWYYGPVLVVLPE